MDRRSVLKLLGSLPIGTTACAKADEPQNNEMNGSKKKIIVIGAGLAGLAAAKLLKDNHHDVTVLEARSRIGGRIHTSNKWQDLSVDLGATWIHGTRGNPLSSLADEINAQRLNTFYARSKTYATNGTELDLNQTRRLEAIKDETYDLIEQAQNHDDVSIEQAVSAYRARFAQSGQDAKYLDFILSSEMEQEYGGNAAELSSHYWDSAKEFGGDDALFVKGFGAITQHLSNGQNIQLNQIVKEIRWMSDKVKVMTETGEYDADQTIITLPLGVLKARKVAFTPELPRPINQAIGRLSMGLLNKCYLRFSDAFWPGDVDWLEHIPANKGEWSEWVSFKRVANVPVLLGFNAAQGAQAKEALSDAQTVESAMAILRTIFGNNIPMPIDSQTTRWAGDEFALGAYSFNPVGATPETRETFAMPIANKLFFAGEAVHSEYFGTAHGAYLSGIAAAEKIISA